ncbi:MAG TPA: hypothetical protein V6D47_06205 [Oscillatoriaceae cyanobacterium]
MTYTQRALVLLSLLLAGCGTAGGPVPYAPVNNDAPVQVIGIPTLGAAPMGTTPIGSAPVGSAPQGQAQQALMAMGAAVRALSSARYDGVMYCRGSVGNRPAALPQLPDGTWEATTNYHIEFRQPQTYRIQVTTCTNPKSNGMKMVVQGDQASIKLTGLLGLATFHKSLGDSQMLNFRGARLDQGSLDGLASRFGSGPVPDARWIGMTPVDGQPLELIEIPHAPPGDPAIVREVIGLDPQTHLPRLDAEFTATQKVYEMKIQNWIANPSLPDSDFTL